MNEAQSAAIYLRVGPMGQTEAGERLKDQKKYILLVASELGCFVEAEYIDTARSRPCEQPADFQRLIADCCSDRRPYKRVIVHDFTRISRYRDEVEAYRQMLEEVGVELISAQTF